MRWIAEKSMKVPIGKLLYNVNAERCGFFYYTQIEVYRKIFDADTLKLRNMTFLNLENS